MSGRLWHASQDSRTDAGLSDGRKDRFGQGQGSRSRERDRLSIEDDGPGGGTALRAYEAETAR